MGCLTEFTTGINTQDTPKDCVRLNHLLSSSEYSDALADIQENADGDVERGYDIISTDGVISTNFVPGTGGDVELNHGGNIIGGIHNHTTDGYSMFSGEDILKLYTYSVANPTAEVKSISTTVVTQVGTFSLTINDRSMLSYILNTESIGLKGLNDLLNGKYQKATTANDFKKALLDVFKEIQEGKGMPDNPVNLYEFDSFSNSFKLVTLDSNGEPKSESCI